MQEREKHTGIVRNSVYENAQRVINGEEQGIGPAIVESDGRIIHFPGKRSTEEIQHIFPFSHRFISEVLTSQKMRHILFSCNELALFIDAQTGAGKTTFVFGVCYPIVRERGQKLLVLSNRKLIKTKIKYDAIKAACPEVIEDYTAKGIEKEHHFGDIDVFSYQDFFGDFPFQGNREQLLASLAEYGMVIFDEVHYAVSDAGFNPYTSETMEFLLSNIIGRGIPRIYMTGTPNPVFDYIYRKEEEYRDASTYHFCRRTSVQESFYYCNFRRDYNYVDVILLENDADLIQRINGSNVKWLIFMNDIAKAEKMKEKINGKKVAILTSEGLKDDSNKDVVQSIVENDTMGNLDVLFTTTVLDVGINIKDEVNIVSYLKEKNSFIQAIGRKRIRSKESVTLFIPKYSAENIKRWIGTVRKNLEELRENEDKIGSDTKFDGRVLPEHFYVRRGYVASNTLCSVYYDSILRDWDDTLQQLDGASDKIASMIIFSHFLSWLGKKAKEEPEEESKKELLAIIERYRGQEMSEEMFDQLCQELKPYDKRKDVRPGRVEKICVQTVNKILKDLQLKIEHKTKEKVHTYKIVETEEK